MRQDTDDERQLLERLRSGDRGAFERIYRQHNASMIRVCTGLVGSRATAEEVVQDAWIAILQNIGRFEGRASLAGWMFAIVLNKAKSRARMDGRSVSFDDGGEDHSLAAAFDGRGRWKDMPELWEEVTPERILAGRRVLDHVTAAIDALPPAQRAVILMRGQQGLGAADVCEALGLAEGNMRVLLHRARLAVRAALDDLM